MPQVSLLPAPPLNSELQLGLRERAERRMLSPARDRGYELRLLGATVLPQRRVIVRSRWGTWMFVDHLEDPTAELYAGRIPVPAEQHARLLELERVGVDPDVVWLGHELPERWREGDPVPVPAPAHIREKDQRLTGRLTFASRVFLLGAVATLGLAAAPLAALATLGAGADPIVLGGVRHPDAPVVQWALLAQWEWR